jgi:TPR repeat protein
MQETNSHTTSKGYALVVIAIIFFAFFGYQAYLNFFVYTEDNPTRHDLRILDDAEDGQAHAQYIMGVYRTTGRQGIERDFVKARRWFEASAAQGYSPAQFRLGDLYRHGKGVEKNLDEAVRLFRLAAEAGNIPAQNALGDLYFRGEGVELSVETALKHYRQAAESGLARAQRNMGIMAAGGHGMDRDYAVALAWYMKAAEQSDGVAFCNLGIMYANGQGVEVDPLRAWDCFYTATLLQYKGAQNHRIRLEKTLPAEWHQKGLYERDGIDCLSGSAKRIMRPVSRVRE